MDYEEIQGISVEAWMKLHEDFDAAIKLVDVTAKDHYACADLLIPFAEVLVSALVCFLPTTEDERRKCGALAYEYGARAKDCARDAETALVASRLCKAMENEDLRHIADWAFCDVPPMTAHEVETGAGDLFLEMLLNGIKQVVNTAPVLMCLHSDEPKVVESMVTSLSAIYQTAANLGMDLTPILQTIFLAAQASRDDGDSGRTREYLKQYEAVLREMNKCLHKEGPGSVFAGIQENGVDSFRVVNHLIGLESIVRAHFVQLSQAPWDGFFDSDEDRTHLQAIITNFINCIKMKMAAYCKSNEQFG